MSETEMDIEIAKALGLTIAHSPFHSVVGHTKDGKTYLPLPAYTRDLNAMHEALKILDANQQVILACHLTEPYLDEIYNVIPRDLNYHVCFPAIHTTAKQQAEAFLKTIGKYKTNE